MLEETPKPRKVSLLSRVLRPFCSSRNISAGSANVERDTSLYLDSICLMYAGDFFPPQVQESKGHPAALTRKRSSLIRAASFKTESFSKLVIVKTPKNRRSCSLTGVDVRDMDSILESARSFILETELEVHELISEEDVRMNNKMQRELCPDPATSSVSFADMRQVYGLNAIRFE